MAKFRMERLGQEIQDRISYLILEGRIKDSRVNSFVSITRVNVSKDISYADVYVSDVRGNDINKAVEGMQSAAGFIQSQLGASMHIRKIPKLRFFADSSISEGFDMIKKLEKLVEDQKESVQENVLPALN